MFTITPKSMTASHHPPPRRQIPLSYLISWNLSLLSCLSFFPPSCLTPYFSLRKLTRRPRSPAFPGKPGSPWGQRRKSLCAGGLGSNCLSMHGQRWPGHWLDRSQRVDKIICWGPGSRGEDRKPQCREESHRGTVVTFLSSFPL